MRTILAVLALTLAPACARADDRPVGKLTAELSSPNANTRESAAVALGELGKKAKAAVPALARALSDGSAIVRCEAADALGKIGPEAEPAGPALVSAFSADDDPNVRKSAVRALGKIRPGDKEVVASVAGLLSDRDLCEFAVKTLSSIGPPAIPGLTVALGNPEADVRYAAAEALGDMRKPQPPPAPAPPGRGGFLSFSDPEPDMIDIDLGEAAVKALGKALSDRDWRVRGVAADTCAKLGQQGAPIVQPLIRALADKRVRLRVIEALERIGPEAAPAVPALIEVLGDKDEDGRGAAALALGSIGQQARAAVPKLVALLEKDPHPHVRLDAANSLGALGPDAGEAVPALVAALAKAPVPEPAEAGGFVFTSGELWEAAEIALQRIGKRAVPALKAALPTADPGPRAVIVRTIAAIERTIAAIEGQTQKR